MKVSAPLDNTCLDRSTCCRYPVLPLSPPDVFVHVFSRYPPLPSHTSPPQELAPWARLCGNRMAETGTDLKGTLHLSPTAKESESSCLSVKTVRPEHSCVCVFVCVRASVCVWRGGLKTKGFRGGGLTLFVSVHLWRLHMNRAEERI